MAAESLSTDDDGVMIAEMEAHLQAIRTAAHGDPRRELDALYLLAVEREALAVVGYGGDGIQERVGRLVAGARALDDGDLVVTGHVCPVDQVVLRLVLEGAAAGELDPLEELGDELLRIVQELLHSVSLTFRVFRAKRR